MHYNHPAIQGLHIIRKFSPQGRLSNTLVVETKLNLPNPANSSAKTADFDNLLEYISTLAASHGSSFKDIEIRPYVPYLPYAEHSQN